MRDFYENLLSQAETKKARPCHFLKASCCQRWEASQPIGLALVVQRPRDTTKSPNPEVTADNVPTYYTIIVHSNKC